MLVNICMKFHEGILNGFQVTERTQFCDRQTDGWMDTDDPGKNNMSPNPKRGRHKYREHHLISYVIIFKRKYMVHHLISDNFVRDGFLCQRS